MTGNDVGETRGLLLEIARCAVAAYCRATTTPGPGCRTVVGVQDASPVFQVPEPWSGRIDVAPILFVSSNPSIGPNSHAGVTYPVGEWTDDAIASYFTNRFGGDTKEWIRRGHTEMHPDRTYGRHTAFWASVKARAAELLQRAPTPGIDFALTEVVHCKSRREIGVHDALAACTARYLDRVLEVSAAEVVVVFGTVARDVVASALSIPASGVVLHAAARRKRLVAYLPHPNARGIRKSFAANLSDELPALRAALA